MAVSKAQQASVNKYVKANYDRINVTIPKGRKDEIKAHAESRGQSVNGFIVAAIDEKMERDGAVAEPVTEPVTEPTAKVTEPVTEPGASVTEPITEPERSDKA